MLAVPGLISSSAAHHFYNNGKLKQSTHAIFYNTHPPLRLYTVQIPNTPGVMICLRLPSADRFWEDKAVQTYTFPLNYPSIEER